MKNKKNAEEIAKMRKQDYVTNKLLLVFTLAFAFLMFVMYLDGLQDSYLNWGTLQSNVTTALWVSVAVFAAGVIWMIIEKFVTKRDTECKLFTGMHLAIVGLFMTICMFDLNSKLMNSPNAFTRLYVFIPLVILLYIIFSSYQREFFFVSLATVFGGVALWNMGDYVFGDPTLVLIAAACLIAAVCVVTVLAQKNVLKIFPEDAKYICMYVSYAIMLAFVVAAFLFASIAAYLLYVAVAYFVIAGIYYTIKLI